MRKRLIFFIFVDVKYKDTKYYDLHLYNLEKYINLISDDRKREILISIFIERRDYEVVCSELKITEVHLKKIKKDAIKDIKAHYDSHKDLNVKYF